MPTVTYICPDGELEAVDVPVGTSIMKAAVSHGIESIVGDCGERIVRHLPCVRGEPPRKAAPKTANEDEMLGDAASEVLPNSRLGCQLVMRDDLASLVVRVAPEQW